MFIFLKKFLEEMVDGDEMSNSELMLSRKILMLCSYISETITNMLNGFTKKNTLYQNESETKADSLKIQSPVPNTRQINAQFIIY